MLFCWSPLFIFDVSESRRNVVWRIVSLVLDDDHLEEVTGFVCGREDVDAGDVLLHVALPNAGVGLARIVQSNRALVLVVVADYCQSLNDNDDKAHYIYSNCKKIVNLDFVLENNDEWDQPIYTIELLTSREIV